MPDIDPSTSSRNGAAPPTRRALLNYYVSGARRTFRGMLTREKIVSGFKTLAWVAPLTVLIWVYAEREQLTTLRGTQIPIVIQSNDPDQFIRIESPKDGRVIVDMKGPKVQLEKLREIFSQSGAAAVVILDGPSLSAGRHTILADRLQTASQFAEYGISVLNPQPGQIEIIVDEKETREAVVKMPPGLENVTNDSFVPPRVQVTAPREEFAALNGQELVVYAEVKGLSQLKEDGTHRVSRVQLRKPTTNSHLSISTVSAAFTVQRTRDQYTIPSMPVLVAASPEFHRRYAVELESRSLPNISVTGPAEVIRELQRPNFEPGLMAELILSGDEAPNVRNSKPALLRLPPGVTASDDNNLDVYYRIIPREASP